LQLTNKNIDKGKKIFFISDSHFGIPNHQSSLKREKLLVALLDELKHDAQEIYLMGDIFDFWFEYKYVVPKGYVRFLGKIAEIADSGIKVNYFIGNHDMWVKDYFKNEIGVHIFRKPQLISYNDSIFYIAHGDGLGPGDYGYKFLKKVFSNSFCKWLFARLHPNFAYAIALFFSRRSRLARGNSDSIYLGDDKERLILYANDFLKSQKIDYFIFGHRHLPIDLKINDSCRYLNIGDWFSNFTYIEYDGNTVFLKNYIK